MAFDGVDDKKEPANEGTFNTLAADQLASYVTRIENLEEEIAGFNDDKKEVYAESKAVGFDVKTLKKLIARRRMDRSERQEADHLLDLYEKALEGRVNGPKGDDDFLD